jgi:tripartite-type tricarboxylate transporter receptor subunit TctC
MSFGAQIRVAALAAAVGVMVGALAPARAADPVADFYKSKQVRLIVAGAEGTSYDVWARLVAKYLPKYLPGHPAVAVRNMPGSGHVKAASYLFNKAPKDGTVIGTFSRNILMGGLAKNSDINFDVTRFGFIGSSDMPNRVCVASAYSPVQKAQDLFDQELVVGSTGPGTATQDMPQLLQGLLGMKFVLNDTYQETDDVYSAMDENEVGGICQTLRGVETDRPGWLAQKRLKVLFNLERNPLPQLGAPSIYDFAKTDEQRQILFQFSGSVELGRPFAAPPDIPRDRLIALRRAFDKAMRDPSLRKEVLVDNIDYTPLTGEDLDKRVEELASIPQDIVDKTNALLGGQ